MKHYLFFLRAADGARSDLAEWLLTEAGPQMASSSDCTGLHINIAVDPPGHETLYGHEAKTGEEFDATFDLTCPDSDAFQRLMREWMSEIDAHTKASYGYDADYLVEKDDPQALQGNPAPGFKIVRGFFFFDDLSVAAARRCWDNHVSLALKMHGFDRYVRYWINGAVTHDAPAIGGATNLQFSSAEKVLNCYFAVPEGSALIQHDVRHFIDRGLARVFTREHIFK